LPYLSCGLHPDEKVLPVVRDLTPLRQAQTGLLQTWDKVTSIIRPSLGGCEVFAVDKCGWGWWCWSLEDVQWVFYQGLH